MARTKSTELFQLIKSMTRSEKGYFKKFIFSGEDKIYTRLFDAIEKQADPKSGGEYDEDEILKQTGIKSSRLSGLKNYLYQLAMKGLELYHADNSVDMKIRKMLNHFMILYRRGLYAQGNTLLKKARKLAEEYERFPALMEILAWEMALEANIPDTREKHAAWQAEIHELLKKADTHLTYRWLEAKNKNRIWMEGETVRSKKYLRSINKWLKLPLLQKKALPPTFWAKGGFYTTKYSLYRAKQEHGAEDCMKAWVHLLETHPHFIEDNTYNYIGALNNLYCDYVGRKQYREAEQVLKKVKAMGKSKAAKEERIAGFIFAIYYTNITDLYLITGQFDKSSDMQAEIQKGLSAFTGIIDALREIIINLNVAEALFGAGEHASSLLWLNKVLNFSDQRVLQDMQSKAKMLRLLVHYELKNYDLLESLVRSGLRHFSKEEGPHLTEKTILKFMGKLSRMDESPEKTEVLIDFKNEIESILQDPFEKQALLGFDLVAWIESKIEKKGFAEVVRKRMNIS